MAAGDPQLVMCAVCSVPTRRRYYWGDTTLCAECGAAWESSPACVQQNPAAPIEQCEADFLKWCDAARARIKRAGPEQAKCATCGVAIYWAKNEATGKSQPVNVEPDPKGRIILGYRARTGQLLLRFTSEVPSEKLEGRKRFTSHFATCPQAREHRRSA